MDSLKIALLEKTGHDHGFEHVLSANPQAVCFASARHPTRVTVTGTVDDGYQVYFETTSATLPGELARCFPQWTPTDNRFLVSQNIELATLLQRAASLSRALPNQAARRYEDAVSEELAALPPETLHTEIERLVRQRIGQQKFREAMLTYWGGACAVTGLALPDVLRASHAKPWAECGSDAERLDVFNGFLLTANLDALFDRFLISFDTQGRLLVSETLSNTDIHLLGISPNMALRWLAPEHQSYLQFHRERLSRCTYLQCLNIETH